MKSKVRVFMNIDKYITTQGLGMIKLSANNLNSPFGIKTSDTPVDEADYVLSFTSKESVDIFIEKLQSMRNRM